MPDISLSDFENILIISLKEKENLQTDHITEKANDLADRLGFGEEYKKEIEGVIKTVESKLVVTMSEGISLINQTDDHDEEWYRKREDEIDWSYWRDYERLLTGDNKWPPNVVTTLDGITEKILGLLKDPHDPSEWDRRGLVIGHVQSGKTANYIGLISKAADAGYKFIIVIAGIHNNLRKQTQQRIDEGFVGRDSTPGNGKAEVGVGRLNKNRQYPVSLTNTHKDFTKNIADQLGADLQGFSRPVVVVIKKNVTTLKNLYNWLREWNLRGTSDVITDIPMLMIDDEADHASINTNKPHLDPTRTNGEIRKILKLFRKSCYIGYTATPFANIFINPESNDEMLDDDLFPRDFIYCLEPPDNYFGPDKIFTEEDSGNRILCTIDDAEDFIPLKHKKEWNVQDIPSSMKQAIRAFILVKAVRILRKQENKHCSMMINTSRFVDVQNKIKEHVSHYLHTLANEVRYYYALPPDQAIKNEYIALLKKTYDEEFQDSKEEWNTIQEQLKNAVDSIRTCLINSKSEDVLDYDRYEKNGESRTVIAVGGLSISRGLTLEGLVVSYMYRNTKMYDTLMQMGRWFGYRENFDDLCRVWLSDESQGWYSHIAQATEELRDQIRHMRRQHLSPKDFGLYVRSHPDTLIVTAINKMRDAERREYKINLSGKLTETFVLPADPAITEKNRQTVRNLFKKLIRDYPERLSELEKPRAYYWNEVPWQILESFIIKFTFHTQISNLQDAVIRYLHKVSCKYPDVDVGFISLSNQKSENSFTLEDKWKITCQRRSVGTDTGKNIKKPITEEGYFVTNKQRVASRGAEQVGLSEDKIKEAEKNAEKPENIADHHYRAVRSRPLLMLHMLTLTHKDKTVACRVPAIGISFPFLPNGGYSESVKYVVNSVYLKQDMYDFPDEEEDYDN